MKIKILFIVVILFGNLSLYAQDKGASFIMEGKCNEVIEHIQKQVNNDSIVVKLLFDNYIINESIDAKLENKEAQQIINYLIKKDFYCHLKKVYYKNSLIDTNNLNKKEVSQDGKQD